MEIIKIKLKSEKLCNKIRFIGFLFLKILDQIFKISTIVESLVTVLAAMVHSGWPDFYAQLILNVYIIHIQSQTENLEVSGLKAIYVWSV